MSISQIYHIVLFIGRSQLRHLTLDVFVGERERDRYAGKSQRGPTLKLKSASCEMKTTTNRNERRPAAPRPAAEVLHYELPQPVTN